MRTATSKSPRSTSTHADTRDHGEWDPSIILSIWEQQRHRVDERIDAVERATSALAHHQLDPELRTSAERAAHTLAGSLGMFGFHHAAAAARQAERELAHPTPASAPALRSLLAAVRRDIRAGASQPTDS